MTSDDEMVLKNMLQMTNSMGYTNLELNDLRKKEEELYNAEKKLWQQQKMKNKLQLNVESSHSKNVNSE